MCACAGAFQSVGLVWFDLIETEIQDTHTPTHYYDIIFFFPQKKNQLQNTHYVFDDEEKKRNQTEFIETNFQLSIVLVVVIGVLKL